MTDVTGSLDQVRLYDYFDKYRQQVSPDANPNIINFLNGEFTGCSSCSSFSYPHVTFS